MLHTRLIISGSIAYDHIMDFDGNFSDHLLPNLAHVINLSFQAKRFTKTYGGTACNVAYTYALLGGDPLIVGLVGNDFGPYQCWLQEQAINTKFITIIKDEYTAVGFTMTDKKDNQITSFYPGALEYDDRLKLPNKFEQGDYVLIGPNPPNSMAKITKVCQQKSVRYLFDPGMQLPVLSKEYLISAIKGSHIIIGNDYEVQLLEQKIGSKLRTNLLSNQILIITKGDQGSEVYTSQRSFQIGIAHPEANTDPTGAGDAYRAGLLYALSKTDHIELAAKVGATAASYAVEITGTMNHQFTSEEFAARLKKFFNVNLP